MPNMCPPKARQSLWWLGSEQGSLSQSVLVSYSCRLADEQHGRLCLPLRQTFRWGNRKIQNPGARGAHRFGGGSFIGNAFIIGCFILDSFSIDDGVLNSMCTSATRGVSRESESPSFLACPPRMELLPPLPCPKNNMLV